MTEAKTASILLVALLLVSSFGTVSAGNGVATVENDASATENDTAAVGNDATAVESADGSAGTDAGNAAGDGPQNFHVVQGEECYEVTALGSGEKTVSEFYGYRAGAGTLYGSYGDGSQAVQQNQVSHVFLYDGADGLSLVMLHDRLNQSGGGGAASFRVSGLPEDREWVVEDDDYPNRDDNFVHGETKSTIHWMWGDERTDGAAVRGLSGEFEGVTIDAEWGEDSWAYENRSDPWPFATDDIEEWQFQTGDGEMISLDKDEPITIRKGSCSESEDDDSEDENSDGDEPPECDPASEEDVSDDDNDSD